MTKEEKARRKFISDTIKTVCGVSLLGMGAGLYSNSASSLPADILRPPGALKENDFLSACIRCGLCVRDCPYNMLFLGKPEQKVATGTPYFIARTKPCEMCDDIPCVKACPTGALDHSLTNIDDSRMGLAVLVDQETCLAFLGLRCEVCYQVCPIADKAITLEKQHNIRSGRHSLFLPRVHSDYCTGCGKCEQACVMAEPAIKILPHRLAKGHIGDHYRLGWQEKEKAGGSLVSPDAKREYNLPEGVVYDYETGGVTEKDSPFSKNPMDTLNK
ncbi:MAG: ferredoxin-type protein NapG [Gammaproteobacteria bacterium]|nr:MAG: ferredoxin-type protein NapG [Gammaproteobacteria bacterium]